MIPIHHSAPSVVEGVSPFTTPGTRLTWGSCNEWLAHLDQLMGRHCSRIQYDQLAAHLDELARHPDFIAAQPLEDLQALQAAIRTHYRPPQGRRAGTSYERVIGEVNNAISQQSRVLIVAADAYGRPRRVLRDIVGSNCHGGEQ